jgi:preprotein translocase subunit SecD
MKFKMTFRLWILAIALLLALISIGPTFSKEGVVIKSIERNSSALDLGMRSGEIIISINNEPVKDIEDFTRLAHEIDKNNDSKVIIKTDKDEYIFFEEGMPQINVAKIPRTNIKTGLDLSGGARAIVSPVNVTLSESEMEMLIEVTNQRLNAFGLSDVSVRPIRDLLGNYYMLVEVAGATPTDIKELVGQQGKFEAKIGNQTVFEGGKQDISDVCRNDAQCAGITQCALAEDGNQYCNFRFTIYLTEASAKRHASITKEIPVDETGRYLKEKLYLYIDGNEVDSLLIGVDLRGSPTTQISIQGSGSGATREEAFNNAKASMNKLQTILLTGSLPFKLEVVKMDTISPTLGEQFTKNLLKLAIVVFAIVSLAIFIKYRKIKLTSAVVLTMLSEAVITLGIASLIRWNLDAAAIAGIIAGMGTGVNDQIVIMDEALSKEDRGSSSIKERIKRALFIIVGAFLTIVAAMLPLFWAGAGLLKGFALTTIIGVSVGILITRPAFADYVRRTVGD